VRDKIAAEKRGICLLLQLLHTRFASFLLFIEKKRAFPLGVRLQKWWEYINLNSREPISELENLGASFVSMRKDSDAVNSEIPDIIQKGFEFSDPKDFYNDQGDVFPVKYRRDIQYHELISSTETNVPSIFLALKSEVSQSRAKLNNIDFIDEVNRSSEEFYFIFNHYLLVRVSMTDVLSSDNLDQNNQTKSFNNEQSMSTAKNSDSSNPPKIKRDRLATKSLAICFFDGEDDMHPNGDMEFFCTQIQSIVDRFSLELISKVLRRIGTMRSDIFLAKEFLYSKECRDYKLIVPIANDWVNFMLIIKNNLHQCMSEVHGKLDDRLTSNASNYSSSNFCST